jgi:hypothetical protein
VTIEKKDKNREAVSFYEQPASNARVAPAARQCCAPFMTSAGPGLFAGPACNFRNPLKNTTSIVTGIALAALLPLSAQAQLQFGNLFGAKKQNPGSVLPEWWNETDYIPPVQDGALHIRIGSAGANGDRSGTPGRRNCDVVYLYAAKAGTALSPKETEECALLEFHIKRGIDWDKRNVGDVFVRQEIIAEMSQKIEARIAQFRATQLFYFRAAGISVGTYDFAAKSAPVKINWQGYISDSAAYIFRAPGIDENVGNWMTAPFAADQALAREVEAARYSNSKSYLALAYNRIVFEVTEAKQVSNGQRPTRAIGVQFREISFRLMDTEGRANRLSIERQ